LIVTLILDKNAIFSPKIGENRKKWQKSQKIVIIISIPGIAETFFDMDGIRVNLIDVGGQRSERKKWLHCFESVDAVLFVAAISEYDQVSVIDNNSNDKDNNNN
jgi:hypothetical protein